MSSLLVKDEAWDMRRLAEQLTALSESSPIRHRLNLLQAAVEVVEIHDPKFDETPNPRRAFVAPLGNSDDEAPRKDSEESDEEPSMRQEPIDGKFSYPGFVDLSQDFSLLRSPPEPQRVISAPPSLSKRPLHASGKHLAASSFLSPPPTKSPSALASSQRIRPHPRRSSKQLKSLLIDGDREEDSYGDDEHSDAGAVARSPGIMMQRGVSSARMARPTGLAPLITASLNSPAPIPPPKRRMELTSPSVPIFSPLDRQALSASKGALRQELYTDGRPVYTTFLSTARQDMSVFSSPSKWRVDETEEDGDVEDDVTLDDTQSRVGECGDEGDEYQHRDLDAFSEATFSPPASHTNAAGYIHDDADLLLYPTQSRQLSFDTKARSRAASRSSMSSELNKFATQQKRDSQALPPDLFSPMSTVSVVSSSKEADWERELRQTLADSGLLEGRSRPGTDASDVPITLGDTDGLDAIPEEDEEWASLLLLQMDQEIRKQVEDQVTARLDHTGRTLQEINKTTVARASAQIQQSTQKFNEQLVATDRKLKKKEQMSKLEVAHLMKELSKSQAEKKSDYQSQMEAYERNIKRAEEESLRLQQEVKRREDEVKSQAERRQKEQEAKDAEERRRKELERKAEEEAKARIKAEGARAGAPGGPQVASSPPAVVSLAPFRAAPVPSGSSASAGANQIGGQNGSDEKAPAVVEAKARMDKLLKVRALSGPFGGQGDAIRPYKMQLNAILNGLSASKSSVLAKARQAEAVFRQIKEKGEVGFAWSLEYMAFHLIDHAVDGSSSQDKVFAYAYLALLMSKDIPLFGDLFLATMNEQCVYTIPRYLERKDYKDMDAFKLALGWKKNEDEGVYLTRVAFYVGLSMAYSVTPIDNHPRPLSHCWVFLARVCNQLPKTATATILAAALNYAGYDLSKAYPRQFNKLILFLATDYMHSVPTTTPARSAAKSELEQYLKVFLVNRGVPVEPTGRTLSSGQDAAVVFERIDPEDSHAS